MNTDPDRMPGDFLGKWVLFTSMGWITGFIVSFIAAYAVNIVYPKETNLVVGLCIGAVVGYSQWWVLRKHVALSPKWGLACAIGMGIPFIDEVLMNEWGIILPDLFRGQLFSRMFMGAIGGLLSGLLQIPVLRPFTRKTGLWVPASILGWGFCWSLTSVSGPAAALLGILLSGPALGFITGIWMIQIVKPSEQR